MDEEIRPYPKNPRYQVSNLGYVISTRGMPMKPQVDRNGNHILWLPGQSGVPINHMVADTFLEKSEGLPYLVNIDGDKTNNSVENLRWSNRGDNIALALDEELRAYPKNPRYQVSNLGYVISSRGKPLRVQLTSQNSTPIMHIAGMGFIPLKRIVAETFIENPRGLRFIVNIDGDKFNNRASNLQWSDVYPAGRKRNPLSPQDIEDINQRLLSGESQYKLAKAYGVSQGTISNIKRNRAAFRQKPIYKGEIK